MLTVGPSTMSAVANRPKQQQSTPKPLLFKGGDSFQKRLERDELFSKDLRAVISFFEGLPLKNDLFATKAEREAFERLLIQKDLADYSQRDLEDASAGGKVLGGLFQNMWNQAGVSQQEQRDILKESAQREGLTHNQDASYSELSGLMGQYTSHNYKESIGNNYGISEESEQTKEDAVKLLRSAVVLIASSLEFCKSDPDMKKIVGKYHLLTNPTPEGFQAAMKDWCHLFEEDTPKFGARTKLYGKSRRNNARKVYGILTLGMLGSSISFFPLVGWPVYNAMNKNWVLNPLIAAYKLNLNTPVIKSELKKIEEFRKTTTGLEKGASTLVAAGVGTATLGIGLALAPLITGLSGMAAEGWMLYVFNNRLSQFSNALFDAVEDFPNVRSTNGELLYPSQVLQKLAGRQEFAKQYESFKSEEYTASELQRFYDLQDGKAQSSYPLFQVKNKIDASKEPTPLFRHVTHINKELNPKFTLKMPYDLSKLPFHTKVNKIIKAILKMVEDDDAISN